MEGTPIMEDIQNAGLVSLAAVDTTSNVLPRSNSVTVFGIAITDPTRMIA